jgi:hypothetical protein
MLVRRLIDKARRAWSLPPHVIVQKVIGRVSRHFRDRARRKGDFRHATYLKDEPFPCQRLYRYLDSLSGVPWSFPTSCLAALVANYCRHRLICWVPVGWWFDMAVNVRGWKAIDTKQVWL